ncbi:family 16 glycosylhydrolase [Variovorax sp. W6]|uniref:family 16 glycosylhydrolase n=1 Tax=Variovorax sp. W6 TaxID=3093895 RepID=UPI003D808C7A
MKPDRSIEQAVAKEKSRRQFLQTGAQTATALLGASVVAGCGGGGSGSHVNSANFLPAATNPATENSPAAATAPQASPPSLAKNPVIHSFSPALAIRGNVIVITGAEFDSNASVSFGGVPATKLSVDSASQISATVPASARTGEISVRTAGGTARSGTQLVVSHAPKSADGYKLAWHDEFEGSTVDRAKWSLSTNVRDDAFQTVEAVKVENSVLKISTYTDPSTGRHHTGWLVTRGLFEFCFGYIEASVRFATRPGQWGAVWLMSQANKAAEPPNPAAGVEVDIIEHRAVSKDNAADISNGFSSAVHWNGYEDGKTISRGSGPQRLPEKQSFSSWHTVGVLWTSEGYQFYLDGAETPYATIKEGISLSDEYIKLTCEIKNGGWAGLIPPGGYGPLGADANATMEVDWVRVWRP